MKSFWVNSHIKLFQSADTQRLTIIIIIIIMMIIIIIYVTANELSPGGSGYYACT
jgi:hypothetical protein